MPIDFEKHDAKLILCYIPETEDGKNYIQMKLSLGKNICLKNTFHLDKNLFYPGEYYDDTEETFRFVIGQVGEKFTCLDAEVLATIHTFAFSNDIRLKAEIFVAPRNISILKKIDEIIERDLYVGTGYEQYDGMPYEAYKMLLKTFPKSAELTHYSQHRIATVLREYFPECDKYQEIFEKFLQRQTPPKFEQQKEDLFTQYQVKIEYQQFALAVDELSKMLVRGDAIPEKVWQKKICGILRILLPKYIASEREVYFPGCDLHGKKPDFLLVDHCGFVDVLEIKSAAVSVLSPRKYRNNYVPSHELIGAIQQTEKYIFCLNTNGKAKDFVKKKLSPKVPKEVEVSVVNPQGFIFLGRSKNFTKEQQRDFELIKRQYKHIAEIMTYDDLLQRLNNIKNALSLQIEETTKNEYRPMFSENRRKLNGY